MDIKQLFEIRPLTKIQMEIMDDLHVEAKIFATRIMARIPTGDARDHALMKLKTVLHHCETALQMSPFSNKYELATEMRDMADAAKNEFYPDRKAANK